MSDALDPKVAEIQSQIWRKRTPAEKVRLTELLWFEARRFKRGVLRDLHPDWDDERVEDAVRKAMRGEQP